MQSVIDWFLSLDKQLRVTSPFGWRPLDGEMNFHQGVDLAHIGGSPTGFPTPVPSQAEILSTGFVPGGWGNWVLFRQVGADYGIRVAHLHDIKVASGAIVPTGTNIGGMGQTGYSYGVHWHIEVIYNGEPVDGQQHPLYMPDMQEENPFTALQLILNRRLFLRRR